MGTTRTVNLMTRLPEDLHAALAARAAAEHRSLNAQMVVLLRLALGAAPTGSAAEAPPVRRQAGD